ncbi:hypothetical protein [Paenarthrobacter nitroguajacolicus]|uniref:hypothetical protein n=1 Tax=Paenarthrobacter nitroguajacolicus TaxID=211146 RepID=UPI00286076EA|nr:hypothetical protein [Paenarthrobacter nitroguajacolicus]MDR6638405.1 hypothetical protein [Paenarthrobacter nitroguajacolicus]
MTEPLEAAESSASTPPTGLAVELLDVVQSLPGVSAVYPAQPLWQSIAGAALSAVTGEDLAPISLTDTAETLAVKARIGVNTPHPAPAVAREVAQAIRTHLLPRAAVVEVYVVKVGG